MSAIIIPYRDRQTHLSYFLENTVPLLQKHLKDVEVIVVEQNEGKLFNRGKLLNVGFKEMNHCKYFFTHDVDINPYEETIKKIYNMNVHENEIMGIYTSCADTLGGVIKFGKNVFEKVNGFPNDIWGWGMEDIALQNRVNLRKIDIRKNIIDDDEDRHEHFKIFNDINDRLLGRDWQTARFWEVQQINRMPKGVKEMRLTKNGLSNLNYQILRSENLMKNVKKITVDIGGEGKEIETAVNELMNEAFRKIGKRR